MKNENQAASKIATGIRTGVLTVVLLSGVLVLTACQSTDGPAMETDSAADVSADASVSTTGAETSTAFAGTAAAGGQCVRKLAGGPPPKPAKGGDFAKNAVGKNVARNAGRNILANGAARIAGPLGGIIGGAAASEVVRTEQDIQGEWDITDGRADCACTIKGKTGASISMSIDRGGITGKNKDRTKGKFSNVNCTNPLLQKVAGFGLGHTFTGYNADFRLYAKDGQVLANMKRNGLNHFSGTMTDGTAVTMWRRGG
ncbi:hypothetical protein [Notoacmeibacter sp. MSK16QG-6]|uniref:hypothetical protein n=1 Tax=Notoacmeibacter sp. MSK16QG-6 TaxID=2957982 RepID=UPI0020A13F6B|nr:hypothetical protein [Notoacmeibacter sp. MSK16QG-6]MCP1198863.1 hypothetical protein [Notoacmeibacter sp. MSK16QG-6]